MKKLTTLLLLSLLFFNCISQQTDPAPTLTKQDYLKKSKTQKTIAKIFTGVGCAITFTGILLGVDDVGGFLDPNDINNTKTAEVLSYTGLAIMVGGIPFWIASIKNKKKAADISFRMEKALQIQQGSFVSHPYPALSFRISL